MVYNLQNKAILNWFPYPWFIATGALPEAACRRHLPLTLASEHLCCMHQQPGRSAEPAPACPCPTAAVHVVVGSAYCGLLYLCGATKLSFERVGAAAEPGA